MADKSEKIVERLGKIIVREMTMLVFEALLTQIRN